MSELVSVIIPTKNSCMTIDSCLQSIKNQTYKDLEIIIVDNFSKDGTVDIVKKYDAKKIVGYYNKPEARNIGFLQSKGGIIIFADSDFIFSDNVVENVAKEINKGFDAIIIPEKILNIDIIGKIRDLEKETYIGDNQIEAARVYTRNIIEKVGLFDEKIIGQDEYDFYSRIVDINSKIGRIDSIIYIIEPPFWKLLKKKFNHGKYWRIYSKKHKKIAKYQISFYVRIKKLYKAFNKDPMLGGLLSLIKGLEYIFLSIGIFSSYFDRNIVRLENDIKTKYDKEAEYYEQRMYHSNIGTEYVDKVEKDVAILPIVRNIVKDGTILDIGAGNGRWSKEFLKLGLNVTALDISEEMYKKLKNDIGHQNFKVNNGTIEKTEFQDKTFDVIFSFRSFKYVHNEEKALSEIDRIIKDNGIFIVEIPNYFNPFYFPLYLLVPFLRYIIKKDIIKYMSMTKMYSSGSFKKMVEKNGFKIDNTYPIFFFPHGIFSRINNDNILKVISTVDRMLCNIFTARSLIFMLRKMSYQQIPSNQCMVEDIQPLVSVVIPTYNRKDKLIRLIESVLKSNYNNMEIIVVDDASADGTYENINEKFPNINIIRMDEQKFSSHTRNIGIKCAKGIYIFLIDDDNIIENITIEKLVKVMEHDKSIGIIAPLMLYYDRPNIVWCAGGKLNKMLRPYHLYKGQKIQETVLPDIIKDIDYFPNAFMIRDDKKVWNDSKNFPHNWGEIDFCLRIKNLRYDIVALTSVKIWHDIGYNIRTTRLGEFKTKDQSKSRILFLRKYGKMYQKIFFWTLFFLPSTLYYFLVIYLSRNESLIKKDKDRYKILKSYLLGTMEGIINNVRQ